MAFNHADARAFTSSHQINPPANPQKAIGVDHRLHPRLGLDLLDRRDLTKTGERTHLCQHIRRAGCSHVGGDTRGRMRRQHRRQRRHALRMPICFIHAPQIRRVRNRPRRGRLVHINRNHHWLNRAARTPEVLGIRQVAAAPQRTAHLPIAAAGSKPGRQRRARIQSHAGRSTNSGPHRSGR